MNKDFMKESVDLAIQSVISDNGGPFGCVIVKDGKVVGKGMNSVTSTNDPTAHAEVVAIRDACKNLNTYQLEECEIYTSCEPCPMCLGAIYWARPKKVYYAANKFDAAKINFDDQFIYEELELDKKERKIPFEELLVDGHLIPFETWDKKIDKDKY